MESKNAAYRLGAPLNTRGLSGGWSCHFEFTDEGEKKDVSINKETLPQWLNQIKLSTSPSVVPDVEEIGVAGKTIVVFSVPEYPVKPVSCKGRYFKRVANSNHILELQEISDLYLSAHNTSWDSYISSNYSLEKISLEKVNTFINLANEIRVFRCIIYEKAQQIRIL